MKQLTSLCRVGQRKREREKEKKQISIYTSAFTSGARLEFGLCSLTLPFPNDLVCRGHL